LGARTVFLFVDETDVLLFPPLRSAWGERGKPTQVEISGGNAKRVVFGSINLKTGHRLLAVHPHHWAVYFQAFLRFVRWSYRGWHVVLLLSEDSIHTAQGSRRLAEALGIELIWLPKRAPELNPMDELWGKGKDAVLANRQYASIEEAAQWLVDYLLSLTPHEALQTSGLLSPNFWLK
jgi:hypothetical protein